MKKIFLLLCLILAFSFLGISQVPQLIKYQAVARDNAGSALGNKNISVLVSIIPNAPVLPPIYAETFSVTTNAFGMFDINIGGGSVVDGTFSTIDWSSGLFFLQISIDPNNGTTYTVMGTSQMLSVPYALYAGKSASLGVSGLTGQTLRFDGNNWVASSALFNDGTNIGIGTTNPQRQLHISADYPELRIESPLSGSFAGMTFQNTNGYNDLFWLGKYDKGFVTDFMNTVPLSSTSLLVTGSEAGGLLLGTMTPSPIYFGTNNAEAMRLTSDGKLGLGSINPDNKLTLEIKNLTSTDGIHIKRKLATQALGIKLEFDSDLGNYHYIFDEKNTHGLVLQSWNDMIFFSNANYEGPAHYMFFNSTGYLGLDTQYPSESLTLASGNILLTNSSKGIMLDAQDKPIITRGWDVFATGAYSGLGRWGMFMEPSYLTLGVPYIVGRGIKFSAYNDDSSVAADLMTVSTTGDVTVQNSITAPTYKYTTPKVHTYSVPSENFVSTFSTQAYINGGGMGGAYATTESSGTILAAAVHLPDGAVVTGFKVYFYNNASAKAANLSVTLYRETFLGSTYAGISSSVTPSSVSGYGSVSATIVPANATVNNQLYGYLIWAYNSNWDATGNLKIKGATITYTTTSPE